MTSENDIVRNKDYKRGFKKGRAKGYDEGYEIGFANAAGDPDAWKVQSKDEYDLFLGDSVWFMNSEYDINQFVIDSEHGLMVSLNNDGSDCNICVSPESVYKKQPEDRKSWEAELAAMIGIEDPFLSIMKAKDFLDRYDEHVNLKLKKQMADDDSL